MAQLLNDEQLEFDLGADEKPAEVMIDAPENEEKEPEKAIFQKPEQAEAGSEQEKQQSHRDELENVSEAVQKRIAKLTARMRESQRREQAALDYAKGLQEHAQKLQQQLATTDFSRLNEAKARLETQSTQLRAIIKKAREENDIDTETEATQRLTELALEQRQVNQWLTTQRPPQQAAYEPVMQPRMQPQMQPQQPARPAPSPKAEGWAARNSWFGQDHEMTFAAWGIHHALVEQEGFDPNSDEYYTELDNRIRKRFSDRFQGETQQQTRQQRVAPAVAPASRSSGVNSARRSVRLSPSQVAMAKRLNVPLEEYAKYVKE